MSTASSFAPASLPRTTSLETPSPARLLSRLRGWFVRSAPSDPVEDLINANGGVMSDSLEREIARRYGVTGL